MSNIALPYPVLGRADDYLDADFQATLNVKETEIIEGQAYKIPYAFDLNDEAVLKEIVSGNAKFGFEISCSGTSIRYVEFTEETGEISLDPKKFYRKVLFSPRVFVVNDIKGFKSSNFNPEFGDMKFDFEPGDFLAAAEEDTVDVDFHYLRFEDSIKIQRQESLDPYVYEFGLDGEAIIIGMGGKFHDYWSHAAESKDSQPHLMMTVYKDCMVAALEHISAGFSEGNLAWERGFADILEEKKVTVPEKADFNVLNELALRLIKDDGVKQLCEDLDSEGVGLS